MTNPVSLPDGRCWIFFHVWGRWRDCPVTTEFGTYTGQVRWCQRCGRKRVKS